ncbi:MAG TPA: hypothetical protein VGI73_14845 [Solirubrobacterales bacterium]
MPAAAGAATVVNGDFETGSLSGWQESHVTAFGDWYAYKGTEPPKGSQSGVKEVEAPPQGRFAAITDQVDPDALTLWQDVALEPGATHTLSLLAYYQSQLPLSTPSPDSLSVEESVLGGQPNEQYRIDVMKPSAPLDSVNPEDILATVFKTGTGSPQTMGPTRFSVDLTPFAGQTVRIRAVVVNRFDPALLPPLEAEGKHLVGALNAGLDAVAIKSAGPGIPPSPPKKGNGNKKGGANSGAKLSLAKPRPNAHNGTVKLPVKVPAAGLITASGAKKNPKLVVTARKRVAGATTAKLILKPTAAGRRILQKKHKLRAKIVVQFNPDKGATETASISVLFKLTPHHRR